MIITRSDIAALARLFSRGFYWDGQFLVNTVNRHESMLLSRLDIFHAATHINTIDQKNALYYVIDLEGCNELSLMAETSEAGENCS